MDRWILLPLAGALLIVCVGGLALFLPDTGGGIDESGLRTFSSDSEVVDFLKEHASDMPGGYWGDVMLDSATEKAEAPSASLTLAPTAGAADYSSTNVQVAGVDEADVVKNDGEYLYILREGEFVVVRAVPPGEAGVVGRGAVEGWPRALFLAGDRLVVFTVETEDDLVTPEGSAAPVPVHREVTTAQIWSVKDRENPRLIENITVSGDYEGARLIDGVVWLMTAERSYPPVYPLPEVDGVRPSIYTPPVPQRFYTFHTLASFPVAGGRDASAVSFLLGDGGTMYVSAKNLYLAYYDAPGGKSVVHRFSLAPGGAAYAATGMINGTVKNQFSMDEAGDTLRVATTAFQNNSTSGVYLLDSEMEVLGALEGIAPGERIYAARFIGDRLYLVTFRQIDPLFVIDLSGTKPAVLGALKIPGYSEYLHPCGDHCLIGVGRETAVSEWGGTVNGGLKVALFDVGNVSAPTVLDTAVIGSSMTGSPALEDHRAFFFDEKRGVLVLPVFDHGREYPVSSSPWNGAYVFTVSEGEGIDHIGTITHESSWDGRVERTVRFGETLATVSELSVVLTDLPDCTRAGSVVLGESGVPPPVVTTSGPVPPVMG
jgi:inhibitor of cysteine peptidase